MSKKINHLVKFTKKINHFVNFLMENGPRTMDYGPAVGLRVVPVVDIYVDTGTVIPRYKTKPDFGLLLVL